LAISDEAFNPDMHSPNDMLVDTEEHIVDPAANGVEKDNLTIINPDNLETEAEQLQDLTRADDCM
jgi:ubiquitin carboxyl-terminal hydrolase 7